MDENIAIITSPDALDTDRRSFSNRTTPVKDLKVPKVKRHSSSSIRGKETQGLKVKDLEQDDSKVITEKHRGLKGILKGSSLQGKVIDGNASQRNIIVEKGEKYREIGKDLGEVSGEEEVEEEEEERKEEEDEEEVEEEEKVDTEMPKENLTKEDEERLIALMRALSEISTKGATKKDLSKSVLISKKTKDRKPGLNKSQMNKSMKSEKKIKFQEINKISSNNSSAIIESNKRESGELSGHLVFD